MCYRSPEQRLADHKLRVTIQQRSFSNQMTNPLPYNEQHRTPSEMSFLNPSVASTILSQKCRDIQSELFEELERRKQLTKQLEDLQGQEERQRHLIEINQNQDRSLKMKIVDKRNLLQTAQNYF